MTTQEGNPVPRELVSFSPSDTEIMAGFVVGVGGPLPIKEDALAKGLTEAARQANFLGRFVDSQVGIITSRAIAALDDLEKQGLLKREDGNWIIPKAASNVSTGASDRLNSKVRSIFKPLGIELLVLAGKAANNAW